MVSYHALDWDSEEFAWRKDITKTFGVPFEISAPDGHIIEAKRIGEKWVETGFDMDMEKKIKVDADRYKGLEKFIPKEIAKLEAQNGRADMLRSTAIPHSSLFNFTSEISHPFNSRGTVYMLDYDILMVMLKKNLGANSNWPALLFYDLIETPRFKPTDYSGKWDFNHYESIWGEVLTKSDLVKNDGTNSALLQVFNDAFHHACNTIFSTNQWIFPPYAIT